MSLAADLLAQLHDMPLDRPVRIMNVCGGHERTISMSGLRAALPKQIELIPGPGCPVCICPEEDIFAAIQLAMRKNLILVAFGDMLRVPCNGPKKDPRSLEQAKAAGADVRPVSSPTEVLRIAKDNPDKQIVFFAAGFETTMAPVAALIAQMIAEPEANNLAGDDLTTGNLTILLSGRLTWPAVAMLLESEEAGFDALVAPGHVATIMGPQEWEFVIDQHHIPAAIAGFTPQSLLKSFISVLRQIKEQHLFLDNCYREVAHPHGNKTALSLFAKNMDIVDANWRGIGIIPKSGFALNENAAHLDARKRFDIDESELRKRAGEMPAGCDCARVVLGKIRPNQCVLYGAACTPRLPIGPCMVSDEGACRIWWASGIRNGEGPQPDILKHAVNE